MGEVKAGDRVWIPATVCGGNPPRAVSVMTDGAFIGTQGRQAVVYGVEDREGKVLPDSTQLPQVARRLAEAEQRGEDVRAVVLSRTEWKAVALALSTVDRKKPWGQDCHNAKWSILEQIGDGND